MALEHEKVVDKLLEIVELELKAYETAHVLDSDLVTAIEPRCWFDPMWRAWTVHFRANWPAEELARVRWPADWWQAVRLRWLPKWWLERRPVKYNGLDLEAVYTRISCPKEQPRIRVVKAKGVFE